MPEDDELKLTSERGGCSFQDTLMNKEFNVIVADDLKVCECECVFIEVGHGFDILWIDSANSKANLKNGRESNRKRF